VVAVPLLTAAMSDDSVTAGEWLKILAAFLPAVFVGLSPANKPTTGDLVDQVNKNPDLTLKPTPPRPAAPAPGKEEKVASSKPETVRAATSPTPSKPPATTTATRYLQVAATRSDKQADEELKKVRSKSFEAKILIQNDDKGKLYRVVVGPYKESEVSLAKKDLQAKGYKGVFVAK